MKKSDLIDIGAHETIKYRLRMEDSSLSEIARELDLNQSTVSMACRGTGRSRRVEEAIAKKLGVAPQELWPNRYEGKENQM